MTKMRKMLYLKFISSVAFSVPIKLFTASEHILTSYVSVPTHCGVLLYVTTAGSTAHMKKLWCRSLHLFWFRTCTCVCVQLALIFCIVGAVQHKQPRYFLLMLNLICEFVCLCVHVHKYKYVCCTCELQSGFKIELPIHLGVVILFLMHFGRGNNVLDSNISMAVTPFTFSCTLFTSISIFFFVYFVNVRN